MTITVGVLSLQGAFLEHLILLRKASDYLRQHGEGAVASLEFAEVRNVRDLSYCDALIIPGGESTTIAFVAAQSGLLDPLRDFVK
jgi:pyridoxal 5'-phosphate synthase pdxT subunit